MNISEMNFVKISDALKDCKEWFFSKSLKFQGQHRKTAASSVQKKEKSKIKPRLRRKRKENRKKSVLRRRKKYDGI